MQKIEVILNGLDEEQCAKLISDLISETIKHFDVSQVRGYCGPAPVKKGNGDLLVPGCMKDKPSVADKKKSTFLWRRKDSAPAVPDMAEKFVRCDKCYNCYWSEERGVHLCSDEMGMRGALDPGNGDGCSHGSRR